jgi:peptide chain release factor 3
VRTDAASAPAVAAARGVEVLQREDGELLALFHDKWDLRSLQQRNPELTLEPLVAAQL